MLEPPKQRQGDGSVTEYRGRPSLVDVLRTMEILSEEGAIEARKQREQTERAEMKQLEQRRRDHPEEFFGLADVLKAAAEKGITAEPKSMPSVRTVWPDFDPDRNAATLERQKRELLEGK